MNLQEEWNAMHQELGEHNNYQADLTKHSYTVYERLLRGLRIKRYWCYGFFAFFMIASLNVSQELLLGQLMFAFSFSYLFTAYQLGHQIKELKLPQDLNASIKELLSQNLLRFERILRVERIFGIILSFFIGPLMVLIVHLFRYETLSNAYEQSPYFIYYLIGSILLAVPIFFLGEYMTKVAFGIDLETLRNNIQEMEGDDVEYLKIQM